MFSKNREMRRTDFLNQLGIIQWHFYRSSVLRNEVIDVVLPNVCLLLICEELSLLTNSLICDVLHVLGLTVSQVFCMHPKQYPLVMDKVTCAIWWLGSNPVVRENMVLRTPTLSVLSKNADAKRWLWRQICDDERYFSIGSRRY